MMHFNLEVVMLFGLIGGPWSLKTSYVTTIDMSPSRYWISLLVIWILPTVICALVCRYFYLGTGVALLLFGFAV